MSTPEGHEGHEVKTNPEYAFVDVLAPKFFCITCKEQHE